MIIYMCRQIENERFMEMLTTQPVYFINTYEDAVVRSEITDNGIDYYVKFRGEKEFKAKKGSGVVTEAKLEHTIITREEYNKF